MRHFNADRFQRQVGACIEVFALRANSALTLHCKVLDRHYLDRHLAAMSTPSRQKAQPDSLQQHAADNLRFIRATMESATAFTGVSGKGYVLAGLSAIFAAWLAAQQTEPATWLGVWMLELLLGGSITLALTAAKTEKQG